MKFELELNDELVKVLEYHIFDIIAESDVKPDIALFIHDHLLNSFDDDRIIEMLDEMNLRLEDCIKVRANNEQEQSSI